MPNRASTLESRTSLAAAAREIIGDAFADPGFSIDSVASELNVSRRTLQRALDAAGSDFTRERHGARMRRAARVLARGYWVGATARICGYHSPSHFAAVFKQHYGVSPTLFRRAARLDDRLRWRDWKDEIDPVRSGSSEYFRRRRRRNDDLRQLQRLVRQMPIQAQVALKEHASPPRRVLPMPPPRPSYDRWTDDYRAAEAARYDGWFEL